jgi:hypothetical protein
MLPKMKRKTREKFYKTLVWVFLAVFVFSVAAASIITMMSPANPPGR